MYVLDLMKMMKILVESGYSVLVTDGSIKTVSLPIIVTSSVPYVNAFFSIVTKNVATKKCDTRI